MAQMKNILLALLMAIASFSFAQKTGYQYQSQVKYTQPQRNTTQTYTNWQLSNSGCFGCASFHWKVNRTPLTEGYWQFDLYFYSNSFYANGVWASTYVNGIMVNVDGYYLRKEPVWILFKDTYASQLTSFTTSNPYPKIYLTWGNVSIY